MVDGQRLGRIMAAEMAEQPDVLERILREGRQPIAEVAAAIASRSPRFVLLTARGTSDNAALYAKYLVEVVLGLPAGLSSPSTTTVYAARPDLRNCLLIAVSQSGGSPDLVDSTRIARECGALTLAVTNAPESPLNRVCELNLDIMAGAEKATPATKTYTAQLLTLYLLVDRLRGGEGTAARSLPEAVATLLTRYADVAEIAHRYRFADRLVTTARGYAYATAREAALKIMETSYVAAHAFSGADLLHGPLAMVDREVPVVAIVPAGVGGAAMYPVLDRLKERSADVCIVGAADALAHGAVGFPLPSDIAEEVSPIRDIVPMQLLAHAIAAGRGLDPDVPRGLTKVTETH